jgi:hypothetical protein
MKRAIALTVFVILAAALLSASNAEKPAEEAEGSQPAQEGPPQAQQYCPQALCYSMTDNSTTPPTTYYYYQFEQCIGVPNNCPPTQFSVTTQLNCGGDCDGCGGGCAQPYSRSPTTHVQQTGAQAPKNPAPTSYADDWVYCSPNVDFNVDNVGLAVPDKGSALRYFRCVSVRFGGYPPLRVGFQVQHVVGQATIATGKPDPDDTSDKRHHVITDTSNNSFKVMSWDDIDWK